MARHQRPFRWASRRLTQWRGADLVVSVRSDDEAELTVNALITRGYSVETVVEQTATARLATASSTCQSHASATSPKLLAR
jgi:hypothetical protein